jgi:hypothetical protein
MADRSGDPQGSSDQQQDDAYGPQDGDLRDEPDDEQNDSENNHLASSLVTTDVGGPDEGMEGREKVLGGIVDEDVHWLVCG